MVGGIQFGSGRQPAPDLLSDLTDMLTPEPMKPGLHSQVYEVEVSVQTAFASHWLSRASAHSSTGWIENLTALWHDCKKGIV